jgi:hypothetical protein
MTTWTDEDSANLTAHMIVVDGARMPAAGLDKRELRAVLDLAFRLQVRRAVIADRIGWDKDHLWKWAKDNGCAHPEKSFASGHTVGKADSGQRVQDHGRRPGRWRLQRDAPA